MRLGMMMDVSIVPEVGPDHSYHREDEKDIIN